MLRKDSKLKKCPEEFTSHETSQYHCNYVKLLNDEETTADIAVEFSDIQLRKKQTTDKYFFRFDKIFSFQPVNFFWKDNGDGNFHQLLKWYAKLDPQNKSLHNEHQNELIILMALNILREIAEDISANVFYVIMADEVTDAANNEQFVICFRCLNDLLEVHEDFIGLYQ